MIRPTLGNPDLNRLNTVESYDVFGNIWTPMPNMIEERSSHSLVCVKSKLFATGGERLDTGCEVYDKTSNKFVTLEAPSFLSCCVKSNSVRSRILSFKNETPVALCYDVDKIEWLVGSCEAIENVNNYSTVKVPLILKNKIIELKYTKLFYRKK